MQITEKPEIKYCRKCGKYTGLISDTLCYRCKELNHRELNTKIKLKDKKLIIDFKERSVYLEWFDKFTFVKYIIKPRIIKS